MRRKTPGRGTPGNSVDRITRVNELLKREIADLIQREAFNRDGVLVSVTKVECEITLKQAAVFVSMYGLDADGENEVLRRLAHLRKEIQSRMARHVILKYTPVLHFVKDRNIAEGDRVLMLLRKLENHENP